MTFAKISSWQHLTLYFVKMNRPFESCILLRTYGGAAAGIPQEGNKTNNDRRPHIQPFWSSLTRWIIQNGEGKITNSIQDLALSIMFCWIFLHVWKDTKGKESKNSPSSFWQCVSALCDITVFQSTLFLEVLPFLWGGVWSMKDELSFFETLSWKLWSEFCALWAFQGSVFPFYCVLSLK